MTFELTREIGALLRRTILLLYLADLRALASRLTFAGVTEQVHEIQRRLERTITPAAAASALGGPPVTDHDESVYRIAEEFAADLGDVLSRIVTRHHGLCAEQAEQLLVKVRAFGFHFSSMDIRQDSSVHRFSP